MPHTADNTAERDLVALDPTTRKQRTPLKDARLATWHQCGRSLAVGIRPSMASAPWCVPYPYKNWNAIYSWPYGEVAYDPTFRADGRSAAV
jgi:hypothetical protein